MTALLPRRGLAQILALIVILAVDRVVSPQFFDLRLQDGRLFGSLIDVLNRGTPVALLSLGMVLVIATRGIDLSVGAVMAISGAIAASLADTIALAGGAGGRARRGPDLRIVERLSRRRARHAADRGDVDPDGRRPRHRAAHYRGADRDLLLAAIWSGSAMARVLGVAGAGRDRARAC